MQIDLEVTEELDKKKIYQLLKGPMKLSSRLITRLKAEKGIFLNGSPARTIDLVHTGDRVSVVIDFNEESYIQPENIPLSIVFEDDSFLAVDKGSNMAVHPSIGHQTGTLAQAVLWYYKEKGLTIKVRPINRLDRDTSGLILFAKNAFIQDQLIRQMKENRMYKAYLGIVHGCFDPPAGTIRLPIARKAESIIERIIDPSGEDSITHYKTLECHPDISLVQFVLETGRTHQIRVHAKAMGHPLLGDWLYSDIGTHLIDRQALHSFQISFDHPLSGERITLTAPLHEDMKKVLAAF